MKQFESGTKRAIGGTCLLLALTVLGGAPALSADHVVVAEYFTRIG